MAGVLSGSGATPCVVSWCGGDRHHRRTFALLVFLVIGHEGLFDLLAS